MKFLKVMGYILGSLVNALIFVVAVYLLYTLTIKSFDMGKAYFTVDNAESTKKVSVTIPDKATISQVGNILEDSGLVKNSIFFQVESYLVGSKDNYEGGVYNLDTGMNSNAIRIALRTPVVVESKDIKVTIREGLTLKEVGELLESKEVISKEDFLNACTNEEFDYFFLNELPPRENRLEGYLFPDTYFFTKNMTGRQVVTKMLNRFNEIYTDAYINRTAELGLTIDDVVKIASIIEKEVRVPEERAKVASVIYNRLKVDMRLQMCSSVLYVLDKRKDRLLEADLNVKSPYNTYLNAGLPVGPISNPGEACIRAALYPDDTNYVYFVVKNEETGEHVFTNNYEEFLKAKSDFNQKY